MRKSAFLWEKPAMRALALGGLFALATILPVQAGQPARHGSGDKAADPGRSNNHSGRIISSARIGDSAGSADLTQDAAAPGSAGEERIVIKFADQNLPPIRVIGEAQPGNYGVSASPAAQAAADRVALETPPPDLEAFRLVWEDHEIFDTERLDALTREHFWHHSACINGDDLADGYGPDGSQALTPTPADRHPAYNLSEYLAERAAWQRARARALARQSAGATTSQPAPRAETEALSTLRRLASQHRPGQPAGEGAGRRNLQLGLADDKQGTAR